MTHNPEHRDTAPKPPVEQESTEVSYLERARQVLTEAMQQMAKVFRSVDTFQTQSLSPDEQTEARSIKAYASKMLQRLYNDLKGALRVAPAVLFLGGEATPLHTPDPAAPIDREQLTIPQLLVDKFISSDVIDMYNQCVEFKQTRVDGVMSDAERQFKEDLSARMLPYGYVDFVHPNMMAQHIEARTKELNTLKAPERIYTEEKMDQANLADQIRFDLFRRYLGLEPRYDFLQPSLSRPTQETNPHAEYVSFDPKMILESIHRIQSMQSGELSTIKGGIDYPEIPPPPPERNFDGLIKFIQQNGKLPNNELTGQLGRYQVDVGSDPERQEQYISYYDVWDVDPPELRHLGMDVDQFNFPFEVYGRIYESDVEKFIARAQSEPKD